MEGESSKDHERRESEVHKCVQDFRMENLMEQWMIRLPILNFQVNLRVKSRASPLTTIVALVRRN